MTTKETTLKMLKPRRWISGVEIEVNGGSLRRLRELRGDYEIKSRKLDGMQAHEYRLVRRKTDAEASWANSPYGAVEVGYDQP